MFHGGSCRCPPTCASAVNSDNTLGGWSTDRFLPLGAHGAAWAFKGKAELLDTEKVCSVRRAVALLNSGAITILRDFCVVWSESANMYCLLFRCTKQAAIAALDLHEEGNLHGNCSDGFLQLEGVSGMTNNCVLFIADDSCQCRNSIVVYFPGDMQDCTADEMDTHGHLKYDRYNLQATSRMLAAKHNAKCCLCVRASNLTAGTYAGYANFCPAWDSERNSVPSYDGATGRGTEHLAALLDKLPSACVDSELELVGFSRGVVVLNQLIAELAQSKLGRSRLSVDSKRPSSPKDVAIERVWTRVRAVHHVDAGNNGPCYPPPEDSVRALQSWRSLASTDLSWHVHYTPYTFKAGPPNKEPEQNAFIDAVRPHAGDILHIKLYFGPDASLLEHFRCLEEYCVSEVTTNRASVPTRCPENISGNTCGGWSTDRVLPLGVQAAEKAFKGKAELLDIEKVCSVRRAVALLNSGDITNPRDFCVVWSESANMYCLLFRCTKQAAIAALDLHEEGDVQGGLHIIFPVAGS